VSAGVLVLHPWWGRNADVLAAAERLRREGYRVVAPDLYHGRIATTVDEAKGLSGELNKGWKSALGDVEEALSELTREADRVAVLAWSMGVWYSWQLAAAHADRIKALVSFYGYGEFEPGAALPPILGHFAEHDEFDSVEDVRKVERELKAEGHATEFHVYPGTKHWFDEPSRPEFDKAASELAWKRTLAFLDTHLRRGSA
jgi:carboxymethylenebutenolidase